MKILKIVINQVKRSRYTDMTAIIPIIIDFMNNNQEIYRNKYSLMIILIVMLLIF